MLEIVLPDEARTAYFFPGALPGRTSSPHTQRAYFRWVDTYLVDVAGLKPTRWRSAHSPHERAAGGCAL
jgi:hypothetical protein